MDIMTYRTWGDTLVASLGGSSAAVLGTSSPATNARMMASYPEPYSPTPLAVPTPANAPTFGGGGSGGGGAGAGPWIPDAPPVPGVPGATPLTPEEQEEQDRAAQEQAARLPWVWVLVLGLLAIVLIGIGSSGIVFGGKSPLAQGAVGGAAGGLVQGAIA